MLTTIPSSVCYVHEYRTSLINLVAVVYVDSCMVAAWSHLPAEATISGMSAAQQ